MTPTFFFGQRTEFTELDYGGLADIGWQVTPVPEPAGVVAASALVLAGLRLVRRRARRDPTVGATDPF